MKKSIVLAAVLAGAIFLVMGCSQKKEAPAAKAEAPTPAAAPAKFIVGLDESFPPMGFRDEKGQIVGFDIDLAKEAGKRMGVEVVFQPIDWKAKELELNGKKIDAIWNGFTITDERKKAMGFSKPYLKNRQIIITAAAAKIASKADLKGKRVGTQEGSVGFDIIEADTAMKAGLKSVNTYPDFVAALTDIKAGRLDAVIGDEILARYYTAKEKDTFKILDESLADEEYGVGLRLEDTALLASLQRALDEMNADGTAGKISETWFGKDIVLK
jgi:polar amino acid transport system substrate-binding protein